MDTEEDIIDAILAINKEKLMLTLHGSAQKANLLKDIDVYHHLILAVLSHDHVPREATQIVYALSIHGADINYQDENGDIALLCYMRDANSVVDDLLQAFLRCGADVTVKNKFGEDVLSHILQADNLTRQIKARVLEYMPGIWCAVDSDDACTVRRLINQWCGIRVVKNGMSVVDLAFSKGTENIIRVITGIGQPMDFAHGVLAGDCQLVKHMLVSKYKVNVNIKNMSEGGATPLFYAMCQNNVEMVDLLLQHGASLISGMQGENEMELPLYFAALSWLPRMDTNLLRCTIPHGPISVDQLYYRGRNVIFYCIENDVDLDLFEDILRHCSAHVITQKIQDNLDAREYVHECEKFQYISRIDKVVMEWCSDETNAFNRNILALHGYPITETLVTEFDGTAKEAEHVTAFLQLIPEYEEYKMRLRSAVEDGDDVMVKEMLYCESWSTRGLEAFLVDSRVFGDGQPLLHKAVLRDHIDVVREIAEFVFHQCNRKLDTIRDQYFRTALHYLYGMDHGKHMIYILEDLGMSEFSMDKDGRSPLAFKDRRGQQEMGDLLNYHLLQDFSTPEPDPWAVALPIPIMGYLAKCVHAHHAKKNPITPTASSPDQYDSIDGSATARLSCSGYDDGSDQYSQIGTVNGQSVLGEGLNVQPAGANTNVHYTAHGFMGYIRSENTAVEMDRASDVLNNQNQYGELSSKDHSQRKHTRNGGKEYFMVDGSEGELFSDISSREHKNPAKLCKSKSEDTIETRMQYLQNSLQIDDLENGQFKGDNSDSYSEGSELEENYEGDYSDIESEEEQMSGFQANYCVIL